MFWLSQTVLQMAIPDFFCFFDGEPQLILQVHTPVMQIMYSFISSLRCCPLFNYTVYSNHIPLTFSNPVSTLYINIFSILSDAIDEAQEIWKVANSYGLNVGFSKDIHNIFVTYYSTYLFPLNPTISWSCT